MLPFWVCVLCFRKGLTVAQAGLLTQFPECRDSEHVHCALLLVCPFYELCFLLFMQVKEHHSS